MSLIISKTERGGNVLRYEGYDYVEKRKNLNGIISWRCRGYNKYRCNSIMKTSGDHVIVPPTIHCHDGDPIGSEMRAAQAVMRNCCCLSLYYKSCSSRGTGGSKQ